MEYIKATGLQAEQIYALVQKTIQTVYPKYYRDEIVDFFCKHHSFDNIMKDIESGLVGVLECDDRIVGTGCYRDNHITRVYVAPEFQGKGYGRYIMQCIENEISKKHRIAYLDASLPASHFYENGGYKTVKHERYPVENDVILVYEVMEKTL